MPKLKIIALVAVFLFILFLGWGWGHFYLGNIKSERSSPEINRSVMLAARGGSSQTVAARKKMVLRLEQVEYYTILVDTVAEQEKAWKKGQELGQKGFPVIISGEGPFVILLGLAGEEGALQGLEKLIKQVIPTAEIRPDYLNKVAYKFRQDDSWALEKMAPFWGKVSLSLEKGLLLYTVASLNEEIFLRQKSKFGLLADSLAELAAEGQKIVQENPSEMAELGRCWPDLCRQWSESLRQVECEWTDAAFFRSQQKGLAFLEEYHRLLQIMN